MKSEDTAKNKIFDTILLLRVYLGESEVERRAFTIKRTISIGRDAYTDVYLEDPTVSRLHAVIERRDGDFLLSDRSSNGTLVNGSKVVVEHHLLFDKDEVTVGRYRVMIEIHTDSKESLYNQAKSEGWTIDDDRTIPRSA
jgi:pSer/pThr/pTyr-binding forkhead associated (FHA) protein